MSGSAHGAALQASVNPAAVTVRPTVVRVEDAGAAAQEAEFVRARAAAQAILGQPEFQPVQRTWWDRLKEKLWGWIGTLFMGIDRVTTSAPWLGKLLEWVLFIAASVGLLVWVLRVVQRQRLRLAVGPDAARAATEWARESEDWRRMADEQAERGAWREAIHALYWAAIVLLEQRRAWRHNPARTPREYVRLLRADSTEQRELRGLTRALERTWYGQRAADREEYSEARESFQRLAAGSSGGGSGIDTLAGGRA
ncbi:MAG TPA: DUF4129 domain-containing protein [Acidobacteriaceae bacterium]|jgi:hypothetical protein|nr:DUF4129 domain-containing protein [Acidobacteriaceae bacterium]